MSIKFIKNNFLIKPLLCLSLFLITSCGSLEIIPNETDYFEEAMVSKGNNLDVDTMTLNERIKRMFGNGESLTIKSGITFKVALDQFSVMPLLSVDSVSGIIITDWYSASSNPDERVKFNIIIKDEMMQDSSIDIKMFKETYNGSVWISSIVNADTALKIRNLILEKSRRLQATAKLS